MIVALYAVVGIGILMRKKWGWDWGRGTNTVNLLLGVYQLSLGVKVQVILLPIELFILIALYCTKPILASSRSSHERMDRSGGSTGTQPRRLL